MKKEELLELIKVEYYKSIDKPVVDCYFEDIATKIAYRNGFETDNVIVTRVVQVGGEGEGSTWYVVGEVVIKDTNSKYYIQMNAHYDSWNGPGFDCQEYSLVEPAERTITVYNKVS